MKQKQAVQSVWNKTRNTQLVNDLEMATNPFTRFKGLMLRSGLAEGRGLWIEPCADIHSFFMRFPFDAVFIDKDGKVLYLAETIPPWQVVIPMLKGVKGIRTVLELPPGTISKTNTQLGDQLEIT